jgi:hypothetical protein
MADDWDTVTVLRKKTGPARVVKSQSAVNEARRTGSVVAVEKKCKLEMVRGGHRVFVAVQLVVKGEQTVGKPIRRVAYTKGSKGTRGGPDWRNGC